MANNQNLFNNVLNSKYISKALVSGKQVKLICVTDKNNNKFYNMTEKGDGTFDVEYGRVDQTPRKASYPMSQWDKKYNEKMAKGYKDITNMYKIDTDSSGNQLASSPFDSILKRLQDYANKVSQSNYKISSFSVTQRMIDEAQSILNNLATKSITNDKSQVAEWISEFNKGLLDLFNTLPRKMSNVGQALLNSSTSLDDLGFSAKKLIAHEQELLDTLSSTVQSQKVVDSKPNGSLLDSLGIEMKAKDQQLEDTVKIMLGELKDKYVNCWYVVNNSTQSAYDTDMAANGKYSHKKEMLFWHGSRNENWLSIVSKGLMIRPTGVTTTGSMFGNGVYFADKAKKSFGYTSARSSYWAHGNSNTAFMAIFRVRVGKQYNVHSHTSECYDFNKSYLIKKGGYDSVFAHAGRDLRNNEYIIYDPAQCTIYALVELKA